MAVAALEHVLHEHGGTLTAQQRRHQQCLRVGGKAGIGGGAHRRNGPQASVAFQCDSVAFALQAAARLMQRRGHGGKVPVVDALQRDLTAGGRRRAQVCSGHDAVADAAVGAAVPRTAALYGNGRGACAVDRDAQLLQKVLKIHDLRLPCRIGDHGDALRAAGGQNGVFCGAYAGQRQHNVRALQMRGPAQKAPAQLGDVRAQRPQGGQVQVDRPGAKFAAAGIGQLRLTAAAEDRTQKDDGRAHSAHQRFGNVPPCDAGGVHQQIVAVPLGLTAQMPQDLRGGLHVAEVGTGRKAAGIPRQHCGGQHRQHTVLGALHRYPAMERASALNRQICHIAPPFRWFYPSYAGRSLPCYSRDMRVL